MNRIKISLVFLLVFLTCFQAISQQDIIDSLLKVKSLAKHDSVRCSILDQLIEIAPEGEWQKYNEELSRISTKNIGTQFTSTNAVFYKYYARSLHNQGIIYSEQSDDDKAVEFFKKSIDVCAKSGNKQDMAISMQAIAQIDIRKGNTIKALNQLYQCLKIFEEVHDEIGIADVHLAIGDICFMQREFNKAVEHHIKSYELYHKNEYNVAYSTVCYKIGVDYSELKQYTKALEYLQKSVDMAESSEYGGNSVTYLNISQIFISQSKYDKAIEYAMKGLKIAESTQNKVEISHSNILLSKIFKLQNKNALAISHAEKSLKIGQEIKHPVEINMAAKLLYEIYKETKQELKAAEMHELYIETKNIIDNQEAKNALLEQKLKYEYEKKELISQTENEKILAALQAQNEKENLVKNIWLIVFAAILLLLGVSAYFLYKNVKQKSIIETQKNNLLKQKLLVSQMNPHFIFNSLNAIQNYIFKQDSLKAGTYLTQFSELIRMILDFSRKDYISIESEIKLLNNYFELQQLRFEGKFDYVITVDNKIDQESIHIPPMLAQPFIENALEHGLFYKEGKGKVDVRLLMEEDQLVYEIEDNGVGIEETIKLKKKLNSSYESLGTLITRERMHTLTYEEKHKGEIKIIDKKKIDPNNPGVKVRFMVPYKIV